MKNIFRTLTGILGFAKQERTAPSIEQMLQSGKFTLLTDEEMEQISAPSFAVSTIEEEIKIKRSVTEILSKKTERKKGVNNLFHSAIVKLSDGDIIDPVDVSGDTAVEIGYHPAGYSQWNEEVVAIGDGTFCVTWNSFNTCD